ncbi:serine protease grass-like [Drosophila bipectinata]|uniref:serine protease grass-like n=1 Tax=Drosophila bipectinata TaxID=42026 RepID=UPI001C8AF429|nr:serine protease grass-like [Drosophila bipectinata]
MLGLRFSVLAICLTLSLQWIDPVDSKVCETHDKKIGKCRRPKDCPALRPIVQKQKKGIPLTDEEQRFQKAVFRCEERKSFCCEDPFNAEGVDLLKENDEICGIFSDAKVSNGGNVRLGSRPWAAILEYNTTQPFRARFKCGGTLITSKFVLTAAHCINKTTLVSVRLGEHDLSKDEDCLSFDDEPVCLDKPLDVPVDKSFVHEGYERFRAVNDIALIRLKYPVQFTDWIRPICLPITKDLQFESQTNIPMEVVGWGITEEEKLSDVPKKAFINRVNLAECNILNPMSTKLCASGLGKDSCRGDSGGPLNYPTLYNGKQRWVQAGIVSYGYHKCGEDPYAVYTDVAEYMGWITETIAQNE